MGKLTLDTIKSGKLVSEIEKVTVKVNVKGDELEFDTYIKPFSYSTAVAQMKAYGEDKESLAGIISTCICDEKGNLAFTESEVRNNFSQGLVDAVWDKIYEVNIVGKTTKSTSRKNSSVKSQSPQEEVSQK